MRAFTDMELPPAPLSAAVKNRLTLQALKASERARIVGFGLSRAERAWLEAVGLSCGDEIEVLRRAPFGGPLHVRMASGGEFALDRAIAANIDVVREP